MTTNSLSCVEEFQNAFDVAMPEKPELPKSSPKTTVLLGGLARQLKTLSEVMHSMSAMEARDVSLIRLHLLTEELSELALALAEGDKVGTLDALVDLQYVLDGTTLCMGMGGVFAEAFAEVHRSNMSKLDETGKPIKDSAGRVVKGPFYSKPDLVKILEQSR